MANDEPLHIFIASYADEAVAKEDWDSFKKLIADDVLSVEALALVKRDEDGKIHVTDTTRETGKAAAIGAIGGAVVGILFPPSLIATALVGAGVGVGAGKLTDRVSKKKIEADVEWVLPPGGSGLVAIFEDQWVSEVEKLLTRAEKVSRHNVDEEKEDAQLDARVFTPGFRPGGY